MTGRTLPSATKGQTCSRTAATMAAFSASGRAQGRAADRRTLPHQGTEVELGGAAAARGNDGDVPVGCEGLQVPPQVGRPDDVEHHVDPDAVRERQDAFDEVLGAVVDDQVGTEVPRRLDLAVAAARRDHRRAQRLRPQHGVGAHAAGAAVHEQGLAGAESGEHADVRVHGARGLGQAGGLDQVDGVGDGQHLGRGCHDERRVAAAGQQRAHMVADGHRGHAVTECPDGAGDLEPQDLRGAGRRRVVPRALLQVGVVHPGGGDLDEHLARGGHRVGQVGHGHGGVVERDGAHALDGTPGGRSSCECPMYAR